MLEFTDATIDQAVVHFIGSVDTNDMVLSDKTIDLSNELLRNLLRDYFISHFKKTLFFSFHHESSLSLNEIYSYVSELFDEQKNFIEVSRDIAKHLKHVTNHPNIKEGELYVVRILGCVVEGEVADAIGIFKSETKDKFLKVTRSDSSIKLSCEFGTNIKNLDKGCLIFNTEKDLGYKICVIDNTNKEEAKYWIDNFLRVKMRDNDFYQTKSAIQLCKGFVEDVINPQNSFPMIKQTEMLSKTRDFFNNHEIFDQDEFEKKVIKQPEVIEVFQEYKKSYETEMGYNIPSEFKISVDATKQSKKFFKSVIKLDKNFHVYVHGDRELIESGFDKEKRMKFYKMYYENES
jgi:hypothetical protein